MLERVPGCYFNIGNGDVDGACEVHNPGYDFNDEALTLGASAFAPWSRSGSRHRPESRRRHRPRAPAPAEQHGRGDADRRAPRPPSTHRTRRVAGHGGSSRR